MKEISLVTEMMSLRKRIIRVSPEKMPMRSVFYGDHFISKMFPNYDRKDLSRFRFRCRQSEAKLCAGTLGGDTVDVLSVGGNQGLGDGEP